VAEPSRLAPLYGLVLAGGRSTRLGRDKAAIQFNGESLLARAVREAGALSPIVRVAVRPGQISDPLRRAYELITDEGEGMGPAAGVLAAQRFAPDAAWLVLACDMPRLTPAVLRNLVARRDPGRGATAYRNAADGLPEPLCAIYEPATLARFRAHVEAGGGASLRQWLATADALLLDDPGEGALGSVNTAEDVATLGTPG